MLLLHDVTECLFFFFIFIMKGNPYPLLSCYIVIIQINQKIQHFQIQASCIRRWVNFCHADILFLLILMGSLLWFYLSISINAELDTCWYIQWANALRLKLWNFSKKIPKIQSSLTLWSNCVWYSDENRCFSRGF